MYATRTTAATFKLLASKAQRQQVGPDGVESVLMLQSIGIGATVAVVPLFSWHCYLMGSAQTTIEYFGNGESAARYAERRTLTIVLTWTKDVGLYCMLWSYQHNKSKLRFCQVESNLARVVSEQRCALELRCHEAPTRRVSG